MARSISKKSPKQRQSFHPTEPQHVAERAASTTRMPSDPIPLRARTAAQRLYIKALQLGDTPFVVAHGPAGTGKTMPAAIHGINMLIAGKIKKLIITRPMVTMDEEELGFLPGDINAKISPYLIPLLDLFEEHLGVTLTSKLIEQKIIELAPMAFMRGRTLHNALVIVDEAQNATPTQLKSIQTRIGDDSRIIITGDIEQTDRRVGENGLLHLLKVIERSRNPSFEVIGFERRDIVRHAAIEGVLAMYDMDVSEPHPAYLAALERAEMGMLPAGRF